MNREITGKHVLFGLIGFFAVVFAVNGIFLTKAMSSFPGEATPKSYLQGLKYNESLDMKRKQSELGWRAELGVVTSDTGINMLVSRLFDSQDHPLGDLKVEVSMLRHSGDHAEIAFNMTPTLFGEFAAPIDQLTPGRWTATMTARSSDGDQFEAIKTLNLP